MTPTLTTAAAHMSSRCRARCDTIAYYLLLCPVILMCDDDDGCPLGGRGPVLLHARSGSRPGAPCTAR